MKNNTTEDKETLIKKQNTATEATLSAVEQNTETSNTDIASDDAMREAIKQSQKPLVSEQRRRATKLWNDFLEKLEDETAERYPTDDAAEKVYNKAIKRAAKQYYPALDVNNCLIPTFMDKYIDELYRHYGIGTYSDNQYGLGKGRDALQWFESYPAEYGPELRKKFNKMTDKERKQFEKARKRHNGDGREPAANCGYRKPRIDWLRVHRLDKERRKLSFDPRECWNFDYALGLLLYPRFAYYRDNLTGYPAEFRDEEQYIRRVLTPIIDGLRDQIIWNATEHDFYESVSNDDNSTDGDASGDGVNDYLLVAKFISERVARAYQLMGKHMGGFWI